MLPRAPRPVYRTKYRPPGVRAPDKHLTSADRRPTIPTLKLSLAALTLSLALAQAQTTPCTLHNHVCTCNQADFQRALAQARTVTVEAQPSNRTATTQLTQFVTSLGKQVVPANPDLAFLITPIDTTGIYVGPAGVDLITLRIYAPSTGSERGPLLWAETYRGQPDMPYPSQVRTVLEQFKSRFHQP
jgi:hypothetical protein